MEHTIAKSIFTPALASETFETSIMKTDEAFLFIQAGTENGADIDTAYEDMKMIDNILYLKRLHIVAHGFTKLTRAGHARKGTSLYDAIGDVINQRLTYNNSISI